VKCIHAEKEAPPRVPVYELVLGARLRTCTAGVELQLAGWLCDERTPRGELVEPVVG
jgi:hypothetical protein